jgi:L-fuculose-phosphate aldolase
LTTPHDELARFASLIWNRHLSNTAGGNISIRAGEDSCYITRSKNNRDRQWVVTPDSILHARFDGTILEGEGTISREFRVHLGLYQRFPKVGAVIHAHPLHATAYTAFGKPLEPIIESLDKFGPIPCVPPTLKSLTEEFGDAVLELFEAEREKTETFGYGVLYARHGVTTAGPTMADAFDLMDRIEDNALAALWTSMLGGVVVTPGGDE